MMSILVEERKLEDAYYASRQRWRQSSYQEVEYGTDIVDELDEDVLWLEPKNGGGEDTKLEEYLDEVVEEQ